MLERRILVLDAQIAGTSGDMMIGALLDLGADSSRVLEAMRIAARILPGCSGAVISVEEMASAGLRGKRLRIQLNERKETRSGKQLLKALTQALDKIELSRSAVQIAKRAMKNLLAAEAHIHGEGHLQVHLHEAGSADTLMDIIGTCVALESLDLCRNVSFYAPPVAVGGGDLTFSHGRLANPGPATLAILTRAGLAMEGGPVVGELTTPTGAALMAAMKPIPVQFYPLLKPVRVGHGFGSRDLGTGPNLFRLVLGIGAEAPLSDKIHIIESNLDDASGEILGHSLDRLMQEGALDVHFIPMFTKKNRPGYIIRAIASGDKVNDLARLMMEETGTIGVRILRSERHVAVRAIRIMNLQLGKNIHRVRVKIATDSKGRIVQAKPEYDDVRRISESLERPMREVMDELRGQALRIARNDPGIR